eukprot:202390-Hanusia_phi.AAC.2
MSSWTGCSTTTRASGRADSQPFHGIPRARLRLRRCLQPAGSACGGAAHEDSEQGACAADLRVHLLLLRHVRHLVAPAVGVLLLWSGEGDQGDADSGE